MARRVAALAVVAVLVLPTLAYLARADDAKPVDVETARQRILSPVILASGSLVYENQVTLAPELLAKVKEVRVREGSQVRAGDVLIKLDSEAIRAELSRLESSKRSAIIEIQRRQSDAQHAADQLARFNELHRLGMVESSKFDDVRNQKTNADLEVLGGREAAKQVEFQIREAQQQLAQTEIRSPIDGRITSIGVKIGETAIPSAGGIPGSILAIIAQTDGLLAEVNVDEADIGRVRIGQSARIVPAGETQGSIGANVVQIAMMSSLVNGQGHVFPVKLKLAQEQKGAFRAGTTCRAELLTGDGAHPVLAVPIQALRYDDAQKDSGGRRAHVYVVRDGRVQSRVVELGTSDDTYVQVTEGLRDGDAVVTGPYKTIRFLHDGDKVLPASTSIAGAPASSVVPR